MVAPASSSSPWCQNMAILWFVARAEASTDKILTSVVNGSSISGYHRDDRRDRSMSDLSKGYEVRSTSLVALTLPTPTKADHNAPAASPKKLGAKCNRCNTKVVGKGGELDNVTKVFHNFEKIDILVSHFGFHEKFYLIKK